MSGIARKALDSVMSVFSPSGGAVIPGTALSPQPGATTNTTLPGSVATELNSDGTVKAIPATATEEKSPLEGYKDLWEKNDKDGKDPTLALDFNIDPKKILEQASKINVLSSVNKELLEKAKGGDQEALIQVISQAGQLGYANSLASAAAMMKKALDEQAVKFTTEIIPNLTKRQETSQGMKATAKDLYDNPAVKPLLVNIEGQLRTKYPNASADEIQKHAQAYLGGFAEELVKASGKTVVDAASTSSGTPSKKGETDWDLWATSGTPS